MTLTPTSSIDLRRSDEMTSRTFRSFLGLSGGLAGLVLSMTSLWPSRNLQCHSNISVFERLSCFCRSHSQLNTKFDNCSLLRTFIWRRLFVLIFSTGAVSFFNRAIVVRRRTSKFCNVLVRILVRRHTILREFKPPLTEVSINKNTLFFFFFYFENLKHSKCSIKIIWSSKMIKTILVFRRNRANIFPDL